MRYPNPHDEREVECYVCSDELPVAWAVKRGDAYFCLPCSIDDAEYTGRPMTNHERILMDALVHHLTRRER